MFALAPLDSDIFGELGVAEIQGRCAINNGKSAWCFDNGDNCPMQLRRRVQTH